MINYIFVERSIALVIRNGDFKVKGSHDSSPPITVDLSLLATAVEKLHLSNTILYMKLPNRYMFVMPRNCVIFGLVFVLVNDIISMIKATWHR